MTANIPKVTVRDVENKNKWKYTKESINKAYGEIM